MTKNCSSSNYLFLLSTEVSFQTDSFMTQSISEEHTVINKFFIHLEQEKTVTRLKFLHVVLHIHSVFSTRIFIWVMKYTKIC
jgi:hypothetical protein